MNFRPTNLHCKVERGNSDDNNAMIFNISYQRLTDSKGKINLFESIIIRDLQY